MTMDIIENYLRKHHQLPDDFHFYRWESFPKNAFASIYVEWTGHQCPLKTSGKNKGNPNHRLGKNKQTFVVTRDKEQQLYDAYESETGNCAACEGSKTEIASIKFEPYIVTRRPCSKCKGTGHAQLKQTA